MHACSHNSTRELVRTFFVIPHVLPQRPYYVLIKRRTQVHTHQRKVKLEHSAHQQSLPLLYCDKVQPPIASTRGELARRIEGCTLKIKTASVDMYVPGSILDCHMKYLTLWRMPTTSTQASRSLFERAHLGATCPRTRSYLN